MKVVPCPSRLSTSTAPPSRSAQARVSDRPSPVPPKRRVVELSAWVKRWNSRPTCVGVMPIPVSDTRNATAPSGSRATASVTVPFSVNLAALLSRFSSIWRTRVTSECMLPRSGAILSSRRLPFLVTSVSTVAATSRTVAATSKSSAKTSILPLSTLLRSSTSLMRPSRWRALPSILRTSPSRSPAGAPSAISSWSISL